MSENLIFLKMLEGEFMKKSYYLYLIATIAIIAGLFFYLKPNEKKTESTSPSTTQTSFKAKTIQHDFGTTELKAEPKRIVILNNLYGEILQPLGMTPVGATTAQVDSQEFSTLFKKDYQKAQVVSVGWQKTPDLEKIAELHPDLILMTVHQKDIYDKLAQIAPTVGYKINTEQNWDYRDTALKVADIFDKKEDMQKILEGVDKKQEAFAKKVQDQFKDQKLMYVRVTDKDIRFYGYGRFGYLYETYKFNRAEEFDPASMYEVIDTEKLKDLDPELLIVQADSEQLLQSKLQQSAVWSNLKAVKDNKVIYADYSTYMLGFGVVSQEAIMNQITNEWNLK